MYGEFVAVGACSLMLMLGGPAAFMMRGCFLFHASIKSYAKKNSPWCTRGFYQEMIKSQCVSLGTLNILYCHTVWKSSPALEIMQKWFLITCFGLHRTQLNERMVGSRSGGRYWTGGWTLDWKIYQTLFMLVLYCTTFVSLIACLLMMRMLSAKLPETGQQNLKHNQTGFITSMLLKGFM